MEFKCLLAVFCLCSGAVRCLEGSDHWKRLADDDIQQALQKSLNENVARNVILFVGDGMDMNTITSSRVNKRKNGETGYLAFEKFSHVGLLKTYSANKLVPDSSSTATALLTGVKVNHRTTGVDASVEMDDCEASLKPDKRLRTIADWAQEAGKFTGFVTTTRVTHATPSALYAHTANRNWECEAKMVHQVKKCKDIAKQLIEDEPGSDLNVIFGGGRQCLQSHVDDSKLDPVDSWACYSIDGRDLIHEWERNKNKRNMAHKVLYNRRDIQTLDADRYDYVLGVFANSHLYMRNDNGTLNVRQENRTGQADPPSLVEMTEAAIKIMQKNKNGYFLLVEGGLIDYAHHRGHAKAALYETSQFSDAIQKAVDMTDDQDTLIIVTSDHAHSLVYSGYPDRKDGVLGIAQNSKWDKIPYTTLLYGTGGPNNYQFYSDNGTVKRKDPSLEDTTSFSYSQQTGIVTDEAVHGGSDVAVYAEGPWAHLFHNVHEQTHVAYVIAYASRIGPYKNIDDSNTNNSSPGNAIFVSVVFFAVYINLSLAM